MLEKKSTYIYSIEGKDIYNNKLIIKKNKKRKATFDYSLEAIKLEEIFNKVYKEELDNKKMFFKEGKKQYTNHIINLTFKYNSKEYNCTNIGKNKVYIKNGKKIKDLNKIEFINNIYKEKNEIIAIKTNVFSDVENEDKIILPNGFDYVEKNKKIKIVANDSKMITVANSDDIRKELYTNGFEIKINNENIKFVRFKRSSGSSRVGKCLFIDEKLYKYIIEWSYMGLDIKDGDSVDLAGLEAYISLTTSSIIDTIEIEPKNILILDDCEISFEDKVMVTEIINVDGVDKLYTEPREITITNNIWDGESLIDESLMKEKYEDKGFLLLRNQFFKSACFNTKIQKFFKDNNITKITQLNGFTLAENIEDIKLITTPSSIKYLKYNKNKKDYLEKLNSIFGVVKYDKPTHYLDGNMVQSHYQLLNTLQLSRNDIREILSPSLEYVDLLKNNSKVLRHYLKMKIDEEIKCDDINSSNEFIFTLLSLNEDFYNTDLCTNFKRDLIDSYVNNMRKGHIWIKGNYSVLLGNGMEMLKYTCKMFNKNNIKSLLDIDEVYCKNFDYNEELIGSRSPHITMSNVWLPKNTSEEKAEEIDKYFNSSKQIIHINAIKNNVLELLSGADFDSDQILLSNNKILVKRAKENNDKFLVSTNLVKSKKVLRKNTPEEKCDLDIKTSKNLIGEIVNCSAYLNSQLWHRVNNGEKIDSEEIQNLYRVISQLNVMSCIEIDLAKKEFTIDNQKELDDIRAKWCSITKPMFFKQFADDMLKKELKKENELFMELLKDEDEKEKIRELKESKNKKIKTKKEKLNDKFLKHECTLDYLLEELKKIKRMKNREDSPTVYDLLVQNDLKLNDADRKQIENIINKCKKTKTICCSIWNNENKTHEEKFLETKMEKQNLVNYIKALIIKPETLKKILYDLDKEQRNRERKKKIKEIQTKINKYNKDIVKNKSKLAKLNKELKRLQLEIIDYEYILLPIQRMLLSVLYKSHKKLFISLFKYVKNDMGSIEMLDNDKESDSEIIKLFGIKYKVSKENNTKTTTDS